ncbi:MAG TPA: PAS domain-containing protein, partial [Rhodocyclaceae bacterium]|nr:PAS domain-containing protein [Rhodocyclaceae bacterium]
MSKEFREVVWSALAALLVALATFGLQWPEWLALLLTALSAFVLPVFRISQGRSRRDGLARDARTRAFVQKLIDIIPEPVYIKDKNSRYLMVNQAFARHQKQHIKDVVGKTPEEVFRNLEYAQMVTREDLAVFAGHNVMKEEHSPNPVTGEERFQLVYKQSCVGVDGQEVIIGTNFNITTWRVAERD